MQFKKGYRRFVVVLPSLGIVIKFPFVRVLWFFISVAKYLIRLDFVVISISLRVSLDDRVTKGFRNSILGGVADNWREFLFFLRTRNPFLQPTYFSFFGLFNVQKAGKPCGLAMAPLWSQLCDLTNEDVCDDSHCFGNPDHFCFEDGKIKLYDYGDPRTQGIVKKHGKAIVERFDLNYVRPSESPVPQ